MKESVVKKWAGCFYSDPFGWFEGDEAGHDLQDAGINENYGCTCPQVIKSGSYPIFEVLDVYPSSYRIRIAQLCGSGKATDQNVLEALTRSCGNCRFFKREEKY